VLLLELLLAAEFRRGRAQASVDNRGPRPAATESRAFPTAIRRPPRRATARTLLMKPRGIGNEIRRTRDLPSPRRLQGCIPTSIL